MACFGNPTTSLDNDRRAVFWRSRLAKLDLLALIPRQHFTQPPPRTTEAALIKALEERGIGRPSWR